MLIVNEFKNLSMSASRIAEKFNVSDTYAIQIFDKYIRQLIKKFKQRDRELYEQRWHPEVMPDHIPASREVYLLQKHRWLILANQSNITYHSEPRMDSHFNCFINTFDYEDALFRIDPKLQELRDFSENIRRKAGDRYPQPNHQHQKRQISSFFFQIIFINRFSHKSPAAYKSAIRPMIS